MRWGGKEDKKVGLYYILLNGFLNTHLGEVIDTMEKKLTWVSNKRGGCTCVYFFYFLP